MIAVSDPEYEALATALTTLGATDLAKYIDQRIVHVKKVREVNIQHLSSVTDVE